VHILPAAAFHPTAAAAAAAFHPAAAAAFHPPFQRVLVKLATCDLNTKVHTAVF
jgi:hypothetical protein